MTPDELRALLEEASSGPWQGGTLDGDVGISGPPDSEYVTTEVRPLVIEYNDSLSRSDAALIVALRNHAEALLELWEAAAEVDYRLRGGASPWARSWTPTTQAPSSPSARMRAALDRLEAT